MAIAEVGAGTQRATIRGTNVTSAAVAFPANVAADNFLLCEGGFWNAGVVASVAVTDTRSTVYSSLFPGFANSLAWGGGNGYSFIAYGIALTSGACTVTVAPAALNNYINAVIDEFSGTDTTTPLDVDGGVSTGSSTTPADSLTTVADGDLVVAVAILTSSAAFTAGTGYTLLDSDNSNLRQPYGAEFQVVGTAGSYTADFTLDGLRDWLTQTAGFKPAGGAAVDASMLNNPIYRPRLRSY